jgi:cation-transporting ATPase 13A1
MLATYLYHKGHQDDNETARVLKKFGSNRTAMRIPSFEELFIERATAPFFVFQVICL